MGPDAGRICIALRLQAVAQRVADMDRTSFADAVCDAVDAAGRLGYLGCLHAIVRLAAAARRLRNSTHGSRRKGSTPRRRRAGTASMTAREPRGVR